MIMTGKISKCCTCGYEWITGQSGTHRCAEYLERKVTALETELLEMAEAVVTKGDNEATRLPWWAIVDPKQNFNTDNQGLHNIASMITGPFLSRESAENFLKATRYNFGKGAHVFCFSGHASRDYENMQAKAAATIARLRGE